ncbi:dihydrolipoamide acetyltransferase component of pyruvate dehydrogenase complex [Mycolicibacterium chitae]|uniref:Dihydrolipoamide acetyltransferase component of pyruvate dehydrogenase complex n=1 Tax=Mycolicibacterium chitae TaxID=1792 RepID=A0A448I427_MYCCI|nr:dihydrolipoamide acetyltransferase family protein [Mycolicibacterium chitae]MCV7108909.1 2-oxo acid dehydrogenase subunit E2 [Mycolicibacterium chitae]BBZ03595.1 dihydrolipoamide acetyltransferase component of pyruvate dehydrogenase complex [Mycolicibacterium chitae]VEG47251.1 pyruvate/2-oxoglutarate dehydrogenase complex, dihydrolipoamide acyltransferase component [Mycolicibacterium chitae]
MSEFLVPDLGEGLEDATVIGWSVAVGDEVELNQTLCTLETAKAQVEIPSPYAGRITELGGAEGDVLPVGAVLVRIDTDAAEPPAAARNPVLVGYGADAAFDTSRRDGRPRAKPAVRKLAADLGVDLAGLAPGPDGIVSRDAVLAAADTPPGGTDDQVTEVRGVQAEMAKRMTLSRNQIPDAHGSVTVDCTRLLELSDRLGVTPFVVTLRLLVLTLTQHGVFNSTWVDGPAGPQLHTHRGVHLGIGVATPRGLLVPVVRDAQGLSMRALAETVRQRVEDARAGSLKPVELQGSTFTVSNFGALGLDEAVPVINYPEAAILGIGSIKPRAVVVDGAVVARPTMTVTCAFDHRIADGAQLGAFLGELRRLLEAPETALLDL